MESKEKPIIECRGLSLSYGSRYAFRNINFSFPRNQITTLVGPSGSGKSSFLLCLNRLIDLTPKTTVEGDIFLDGQSIFHRSFSTLELKRRVGLVFQKPMPFPMSIQRNFFLPLKEKGLSRVDCFTRMEKCLREVHLWEEVKDRLKDSALNLSGGQQQRLCMARALALGPEVLLFDEPCSSLDPVATEKIENLFLDLKEKYSIVVVTHNLGQAKRIGDQTAVFWSQSDGSGQLIESGLTHELFKSPQTLKTSQYLEFEYF